MVLDLPDKSTGAIRIENISPPGDSERNQGRPKPVCFSLLSYHHWISIQTPDPLIVAFKSRV
jgi:hypothetical protein